MKILKKAALAAAVGSLFLSAGPVLALDGNGANGNGAQVEKFDDGCFIINPDGSTTTDPNARLMLLETPSGNSKSQCHGNLPSNVVAPDRAVNLWDYPCFILEADGQTPTSTTDSHATITPTGQVHSTCFIKHNQ